MILSRIAAERGMNPIYGEEFVTGKAAIRRAAFFCVEFMTSVLQFAILLFLLYFIFVGAASAPPHA